MSSWVYSARHVGAVRPRENSHLEPDELLVRLLVALPALGAQRNFERHAFRNKQSGYWPNPNRQKAPRGRTVENHYLSLLLPAFRKHADAIVFRPFNGPDGWGSVTYRDLEERLVVAQSHWAGIFDTLDMKPFDVVGFWVTGRKLSDLINSLAVSSLGFTPQFFSGYFGNISVILELLSKSGGKTLLIDSTHHTEVSAASIPLPFFELPEYSKLSQLVAEAVSDGNNDRLVFTCAAPVALDDLAVLFHSSGTTGGLPKIIPNTFKMLHAVLKFKWPNAQVPLERGGPVIVNTLGSLGHIGSFHIFVGSVAMGACVAQSSSMAVSAQELVGMTRECKLTLLVLYATFLSDLVRAARDDSSVKSALQGLNQIIHTGVSLNKEDEEWAHANGIRITTSYGTTETGPMMRSRIGADMSSRALRPIVGANPEFLPYQDQDKSPNGVQLYEVVVRSSAEDCPPPQQFCSADGFYHTNDLFEKFEDGWLYRGRTGDWIKLLGGFCDTKHIEDSVRRLCEDLVHDVVMVGTGRLHPCLIVESAASGLTMAEKTSVSETIIQRMAVVNEKLFPHERIEDTKRILVVEKGTLPRTKEKGNIRRPATEEMFKKELDLVSSLPCGRLSDRAGVT